MKKKEICDEKQIWLTEENAEKILDDHQIYLANQFDGYKNNLAVISILSLPWEFEKTFKHEKHEIEVA